MEFKTGRRSLLLFRLATITVIIIFGMLGGNFNSIVQASSVPSVVTGSVEEGTGAGAGRIMASSYREPSANSANFGGITENGTAAYMGIGTANPQRPLHLVGNACLFERTDNDSAGFIIKRTPTNRWVFGVDELPSSQFVIKTYPEGSPATVRMSINTDGRVGVNTAPDPAAQLTAYSYGLAGLQGSSNTNTGIWGKSVMSYGVYGENTASRNFGTVGDSSYGIYGKDDDSQNHGYLGSGSYGAYGKHNTSGNFGYLGSSNYGVYGQTANIGDYGVYGRFGTTGSYGYIGSNDYAVYGCGINGDNGVYGQSASGNGVVGSSTTGKAGWFSGDVTITGDLNVVGDLDKGNGTFKIDHPLDPENKYLSHSFVESPDMMNVYNGNSLLDEKGEAVVELPSYFEALNRDFRYQLTCIGGYSPVYVAEKVKGNSFKIAGGSPGLEVSWMVTGIRQDAFANAHPVIVEQEKPSNEKGLYLHPKEWGQPEEKGINQALKP